jgi:hypothetical protein
MDEYNNLHFDTIYDMIYFYYNVMKINDKWTVHNTIHSEQLTFDIYRLPHDKIFNTSQDLNDVLSLCTENDANTQVVIGDLIINNIILTPPYRCKGMIIYANDKIVNNKSISMTARGAIGDGNDLYLCSLDNQYQIIPKDGALGGDKQEETSSYEGPYPGNAGYNGTNRQTGGGGCGAACHGDNDFTSVIIRQGGGQGTSYSGGSGGGGCDVNHPGTFTMPKPDPGTGAGGDGYGARYRSSWYNRNGGGGAGNPGGRGCYASGWSDALNGEDGTGGLMIVFSPLIIGSGLFESTGSKGGPAHAVGGSSGGGSINIFTSPLSMLREKQFNINGGPSIDGSGKGGDGTYNIDFLFDSKYRLNSNFYKNVHSGITDIEILDTLKGE